MNKQLQDFARKNIIEGLQKLPEGWVGRFRQMYGNQEDTTEDVVKKMPANKLDWAMLQVDNSLKKLTAQEVNNESR